MRVRVAAVAPWIWLERHPVRALAIALAASALLRLPFLTVPLSSDEGGFLMVADQWHAGGSSLYGDQWVDRPPLLLLIFKLADVLGGSAVVVRLLAVGFTAMGIAAAWWAGLVINGQKGAVAAALVASLVGANISIDGMTLTGETIAGSFVLLSCALLLHATYDAKTPQAGILFALLAGVAASLAFLVKQSFVEAGVFGLVLLGLKVHKTWRLLIAGAVGVSIPLLVTAVWARSDEGPGLVRLWNAVFRFRQRAYTIIEDAGSTAPVERLHTLLSLFVVTGLVFLVAQVVVASLRVSERSNLRVALLVMLLYSVIAVLAGASWWKHYLLQLVPVVALGTALATKPAARRLVTHSAATYAVATSVVSGVIGIVLLYTGDIGPDSEEVVADYIKEASHPTDSVIVAYGTPSIIQRSGLTTPYRYSWSLPVRVRDPNLKHLVGTLNGPEAPTWLVEMGYFNWWGIDTPAFQQVRETRYHWVADICGHNVYLRNDAPRDLPQTPTC